MVFDHQRQIAVVPAFPGVAAATRYITAERTTNKDGRAALGLGDRTGMGVMLGGSEDAPGKEFSPGGSSTSPVPNQGRGIPKISQPRR